jgi:hypothetical protein
MGINMLIKCIKIINLILYFEPLIFRNIASHNLFYLQLTVFVLCCLQTTSKVTKCYQVISINIRQKWRRFFTNTLNDQIIFILYGKERKRKKL